ncbi:MAG: D-alanyl-D-alanine carboxypeptidase family protein [Spirochaetales bacterium]|nr:MAG: D-alanyl-D-alanine carboxypeptidase family protein [Spirochaetales bacterium]
MQIHPDFSFTAGELSPLLAALPEDIQARVKTRPQYFLELVKDVLEAPPVCTLLVDKTHALPETYAPAETVRLKDYGLSAARADLAVSRVIMPGVLAMNEAALMDGVTLVFSSAYRSYAVQKDVFAYNVRELGEEQAKRESAEPGKSQHQLGTTIDFGSITDDFAFTTAGRWLKEHAWEYGFSLSYPDGYEELTGYRHESWHYRYLGRPATLLEREFFGGIQQYMLTFLHEQGAALMTGLTSASQADADDGT